MRTTTFLVTVALLLEGCAAPPTLLPAPTSAPTTAPSVTPEATQSPTLPPSSTPEPTVSPTPTLVFPLPSPTATSSDALACRVLTQSIRNGAHFRANERFSIGWKVKNTGTVGWGPDSDVFTYSGGTRMFQSSPVQLPESVAPGNNIVLTADMRAPSSASRYTTSWSLRRGDVFFCRVTLTINVP